MGNGGNEGHRFGAPRSHRLLADIALPEGDAARPQHYHRVSFFAAVPWVGLPAGGLSLVSSSLSVI